MAQVGTPKRRKPWLAAVLSVANTGWGQFYVGNWKRGLTLLAIDSTLGLAYAFNLGDFTWLVAGFLALFGFNIYVAVDAYLSARRAEEYLLRPCNRWWVYGLLLLSNLVIATVMEVTPYKTYQIPSGSMLQTLQVGDHLMAENLDADDPIERGDILLFLFPEDRSKHFVKRVIGLPGETVEIRDRVVYINGQPLTEPYAYYKNDALDPKVDTFGPLTIQEGRYFMLGDNRKASYDSRFFGPVERKDIVDRALYLYMPAGGEWSRFGMEIR